MNPITTEPLPSLIILTRRQWLYDEWDSSSPFARFPLPFSPGGLKPMLPLQLEGVGFQQLMTGEAEEDRQKYALRIVAGRIEPENGSIIIRADIWELRVWLPAIISLWGMDALAVLQISEHSAFHATVHFATQTAVQMSKGNKAYDVPELTYNAWHSVVRQNTDWDMLFAKLGIDPVHLNEFDFGRISAAGLTDWVAQAKKARSREDGAYRSVMKAMEGELSRLIGSARALARRISSDMLAEEKS